MRIVVTCAMSCALLAAAPAVAQDAAAPSEADALVAEGLELRRQGRDDEALERFARAYELGGGPRALAQRGLAEQALGRWLDAEQHVAGALAAADDPWIAQRRPLLEEALDAIRGRLASVEVSASVEGAELFLNGGPVGTLPLSAPARVVAGTIEIEVRAEGYVTLRRTVEARGGQLVREHFELRALETPEPAVRVAPEPEPATEPSPAPAPSSREPLWIAGGVIGGVAAAAALSAIVAMAIRESHAQAFASDDCLGAGTRFDTCPEHWNEGHAAEDAGIALFVTAGALAVGAAVLFGLGAAEPGGERAALSCVPSVGGVACAGRF